MDALLNFETNFPEGRSGHVVAAWEDHMFIWGGYTDIRNESRPLDPRVVWKYNIYNRTWSKLAARGNIPLARLGSSASVVNGQLIVFGGCIFGGDSNDVKSCRCYSNVRSHAMNDLRIADIYFEPSRFHLLEGNTEMFERFLAFLKDDIIFFGGYGPEPIAKFHIRNGKFDADYSSLFHGRGWNNHLFAFDLFRNEWIPLKSSGELPLSRAAHSLTAIGDKAYLFGGRHKGERLNDFYSLCLKTHQWTKLKTEEVCDVPIGRSWHSCTAISRSQLFLFGGLTTSSRILRDAWIYDVDRNTWKKAPDFGEYRLWHTACRGSFRGEVLVFGGCVNDIFYESVHCNSVLHFVLQPKPLQRICMEVLARQRTIWSRSNIPLPLSRNIIKLTGEGG